MDRLGSGSVLQGLRAWLISHQLERALWIGFIAVWANYILSLFTYRLSLFLLTNAAAVLVLWFSWFITRVPVGQGSIFRYLRIPAVWQLGWLSVAILAVGTIFTRLDMAAEAVIYVFFLGLVLIRPQNGLYAFALALPILTYRPLLAFLLILILSLFIVKPDFELIRFRLKNPLNGAALFFILALFVTAVLSVGWIESMQQFVLYFFLSFVLYLLIVSLLDREQLLRFLSALAISGAVIAVFGIFQNFTLGFTSAKWIDVSRNPDISVRVFGTFGNPNIFGQYLIMTMPLTFVLVFLRKSAASWIGYGIAFLLMGGALVFTYSRGSWLALAVAILILTTWISRRLLVSGLILVALSIPYLPTSIMTRLSTLANPAADSSANYRFQMWDSAFSMIRDFWLTGIGYDQSTFLKVYADYMMPGVLVYHFHNIYLMSFVTGGILLFAALMYMLYQAVRTSVVGLFQNEGRSRAASLVLKGGAAALIAIAIAGISEDVWRNYRVDFMFWIVLAVISTIFNTTRDGKSDTDEA
jgi:O-antigen ligase